MTEREDDGRFAAGNRLWETRSSTGRPPIFATAEELWSACVEYFEWNEANPLYEAKAFAYEGEITMASLPKMRALTIAGLCLFLDIDEQTWRNQRDREADFLGVCTRAEQVIRTQKFEGAAAGLLVPSIIARDLGLAERQEVSGPNGGPISHTENASALLAARLDAIAARRGETS